jgi:MFS transporter, DHA1 family, multidrug resistance protein
MSPAVVVLTITLLLGLQPVTTDLYLPALPTLQSEFGATAGTVQMTLSVLIICFGLAQLVCGPLSDRLGRRPVLLGGMALYCAASVMGALASEIGTLIAWRGVQGAAMAAAVTCGRSMVRDLFEPHSGARVMSRALGGLGVLALLSPAVGGLLLQWLSWHAALLATALFGAITLAFIAWRFEETLLQRDPRATHLRVLLRNWQTVLRHPSFRAWTALLCCTYGGVFTVLASSSFVFIGVLGLSRLAYGGVLAANSLAYIAGTVWCRRLLLRHGLAGAVKRGAAFSLAGGLGLVAFSLAGIHTPAGVLGPMLLFAFGHGVNQPCGQAGVVGPFPEKAGTAASVSGFLMMLTAFCAGLVLGRSINGTVFPLTLGVGSFSVLLALVAWTLVQRCGQSLAPAETLAAQPART